MNEKIEKYSAILAYLLGFSIPVLLFVGRVLIPDTAFDTINYHTFLGARGWDGLSYNGEEFFPTGMHSFFPLFDMVNNLGMRLLGYRLGTITQLLLFYASIILTFLIIKLLKLSSGNKLLDALLHVNIFISLEGLFQLASYFTDIFSLLLIIACIYLSLISRKTEKRIFKYLSTLIISIAVLCKYTNYIYFIPYFLMLIAQVIKARKTFLGIIKEFGPHIIIFLITNIPWMIWNYYYTNNPVFPYFNSIFKSVYFQPLTWQFNFGPKSTVETIFYPVYLFFNNVMLGEYHEMIPDYKISAYIILLIISFPIFWKYRKEMTEVWLLYIFNLFVYVIWVMLFGYARYFMAWEFISGILFFSLISMICKGNKNKIIKFVVSILLLIFFYWQNTHFVINNFKYDISWRPNLWFNKQQYLQEYQNLYNSTYTYTGIDGVDFYLNCGWPNLGYMVPSNLVELPVITLPNKVNETQYEKNYRNRAIDFLIDENVGEELTFVTVLKTEGRDTSYDYCMPILESYDAIILREEQIYFLGYDEINLVIVTGTIDYQSISK